MSDAIDGLNVFKFLRIHRARYRISSSDTEQNGFFPVVLNRSNSVGVKYGVYTTKYGLITKIPYSTRESVVDNRITREYELHCSCTNRQGQKFEKKSRQMYLTIHSIDLSFPGILRHNECCPYRSTLCKFIMLYDTQAHGQIARPFIIEYYAYTKYVKYSPKKRVFSSIIVLRERSQQKSKIKKIPPEIMWAHDYLDAHGVGGYKTDTYSARVVKCRIEKACYVKAMICWDCFARFMVA